MTPWPSCMTWAEPTQQPQPWGHPTAFCLQGPLTSLGAPSVSTSMLSVFPLPLPGTHPPATTQLGQAPTTLVTQSTLYPTPKAAYWGRRQGGGPKGDSNFQPHRRLKSDPNLSISHTAHPTCTHASGTQLLEEGQGGAPEVASTYLCVGAVLLSALAAGKQVRLCATRARHLVLADGLLGHGLADLLQLIASHLLGQGAHA